MNWSWTVKNLLTDRAVPPLESLNPSTENSQAGVYPSPYKLEWFKDVSVHTIFGSDVTFRVTFSPQSLVISGVLYQSLQTWCFALRGCLRVPLPWEFSRAKTFPPSQKAGSSGCLSCSVTQLCCSSAGCTRCIQGRSWPGSQGRGAADASSPSAASALGRDNPGLRGQSGLLEQQQKPPGNAESALWILRAGRYRFIFSIMHVLS